MIWSDEKRLSADRYKPAQSDYVRIRLLCVRRNQYYYGIKVQTGCRRHPVRATCPRARRRYSARVHTYTYAHRHTLLRRRSLRGMLMHTLRSSRACSNSDSPMRASGRARWFNEKSYRHARSVLSQEIFYRHRYVSYVVR